MSSSAVGATEKPLLNYDILARREKEVLKWMDDHEYFFDPMALFEFGILSGLSPYCVEEPFFSAWLTQADAACDNKLILWPRGHYKSSDMKTLGCFLFAAHDKHKWGAQVRVPIIGEVEKFAVRTTRAIRNALMTNQYILRTYGSAKPTKAQMKKRIEILLSQGIDVEDVEKPEWAVGAWRTAWCVESEIRSHTIHEEPSCWAQGTQQARTGFHWDYGMMDDPVGESSAKSLVKKEKTLGVYYELQSQRNPGSCLAIRGTRHAHDDIHNTILTKHHDEFDIVVHNIWSHGPRLTSKDFVKKAGRWVLRNRKPEDVVLLYDGFGQIAEERERGERFPPAERHANAIHEIGVKINSMPESRFVKQFENRVVASDAQIFHEHMFRPYTGSLPPTRAYILTDSATGKDSRSSYRVVAVLAVAADGTRYIKDLDFGRWGPKEYCQLILDQYQRHGARKLLFEKVSWQDAFKTTLDLLCESAGIRKPHVEMVEGRSLVSKVERIEGLEPLFKQGQLFFNEKLRAKECGGVNVWDEMVTQFTRVHEEEQVKGLLLDIPDAISDCIARDRDGNLLCPPPRRTREGSRTSWTEAVQKPLRESREKAYGRGNRGAKGPTRDIWS